MPVPTQLSDLNATAASNSPASTDTLSTTDDYIRALSSILARISAGTDALVTPAVSGAMNVAGNFSVATNKFTVAAASGNTVVAGTLVVTGSITSGDELINSTTANRGIRLVKSGVDKWTIINRADSGDAFQIADGILGSGGTVRLSIAPTTGAFTIASLAGVGTRHVVVDANGAMSAP